MDGAFVGFAPITIDSIVPGIHILSVQYPDAESWSTESDSDSLNLTAGEHKTLRYTLHRRYTITSSPFGAEVVLGDSVIGTTPMMAAPELAEQSLVLRKPGYESSSIQLSGNSIVSVPLKSIWQNDANGDSYFKDPDGTGKKHIGLYVSGAATIISGVAAAYLKTRADNSYQRYLSTGERHLLSDTRHLDTAAGIAIVATQIGLGLFTYFILTP